jgi:hypothetical protein
MPDPHLRASDGDREAVASDLGKHMAAGRLTLAEYDERLARVYAARTYGELDELTADLPSLTPTPAGDEAAPTTAPAPRPSPVTGGPVSGLPVPPPVPPWGWHGHGYGQQSWRAWLATSAIVLTIYLVTSLGNGAFEYFWPMWVIGPWGAVLLAQRLTQGGTDRDRDRRRLDP